MTDVAKYSPNQPRDDLGRFASGAGGGLASRDAAFKTKVAAEGKFREYSRSDMVTDLREEDGGFTVDVKTGKAVQAGFSVSPYPGRSKVVNLNRTTDVELRKAITDYQNANLELLSQPNHYLGGWHEPGTGKAFLDVSVVLDSAQAAYDLGLANDQIAFFDLQTFESVTINPDAKSGQS